MKDEPGWVIEHEINTKLDELDRQERELEERLAALREKERKERARAARDAGRSMAKRQVRLSSLLAVMSAGKEAEWTRFSLCRNCPNTRNEIETTRSSPLHPTTKVTRIHQSTILLRSMATTTIPRQFAL
jgi:hypothetical protein